MEESMMPSISSSSNSRYDEGRDVMEARLEDLCKIGLGLGDNLFASAMKLFRESKHILLANMSSIGSGSPEEIERLWLASVLYSVKKLGQESGKNEEFTLSRILRASKLNFTDFFKEMPQFFLKVGPILSNLYGADWEKRLEVKELQANFVHLSLLSKSYKRAFGEFFLRSEPNSGRGAVFSATTGCMSGYYRFGWLLFLALRIHAFSSFKDLVTSTNGLVSVLGILFLHVPAHYRNFSLHDSAGFVRRNGKGVDLLASLCNSYDTSEDDLRKTMEKTNGLIVDILKKKPRLASGYKTANLENINTEGLTYFEDLMEESSLSSSIAILEKDYVDAVHNRCELDERMFVNDEHSLLGSGSQSGDSTNTCAAKRKFGVIASPTKNITSPLSPPRSPIASSANGSLLGANLKMLQTPVSTAMTTAKWLRTVISPLPSKPSAELKRFFSVCDRDLTNDVTRRAHIILEAIFPRNSLGERMSRSMHSSNLMDTIWAEQRRMEALKLYYRVLEAICTAEAQLLHASNLNSLLTNERFHRCMLACSAELVLATHKAITMMFPVVVERSGITAFDLSKVIESFIRHEDSLPRELRRHLNHLEERLLESMVWEKGSSMYNSLIIARPKLAADINRLGLLADPMPSLDTVATNNNIAFGSLPPMPSLQKHESLAGQNGDIRSPKRVCSDSRNVMVERSSFTSPVKERLLAFNGQKSRLPPPLQSAFASPQRPNPGGSGETCAETGTNVFFSKIVKLTAVRINGLVERLKLSQQVRETVYCFVQQILSQRTTLFFNRHIDMIILCSLYGVAKISKLTLTFKEIINNYRKQPHCKPQVFRSVFVDWSTARRNGRTGQEYVDIVAFYNEIFIPSVKPLLVELGPCGTTLKSNLIPEAKNNSEGTLSPPTCPCPGSPRMSSFPSLPDISPKKVSAAHNVYVSPLRSSKMEVLISNGSRSYYACVGESTHAYQSPSKDLTAINNRINGKKVNSRLNFDDVGLVSDSQVLGSLYPPNDNATESSSATATAAALTSMVKSEQPESES
ncbi:hypothetical protein GIB67_012413 [Kingdonia uniflora]|uniref:Retinoblastoma-related protein n=1 Tax=Kingdonia uniflora TaxID=39325 RepID=A0A7J7LM95_9MAGN|nr:hypothetical protein GIB67_012413 [Kingdonia uniflora]